MKPYLMIISAIILMIGTSSCHKTKTVSNRFIKAGEWTISELSVNGVNEAELPTWEIEDCDVYSESCYAEWKNEEGGQAEFVWQFREKANTFEISHQVSEEGEDHDHDEDHDHANEEVAEQAYHFSGAYDVVVKEKNEMEFSTGEAIGFPGQTITIKIQKK